jgi:hypothetical protein
MVFLMCRMKTFAFFPEEIKREIYLFDPTKKEIFNKTIHQLKFIHVLMQLELRSNLFQTVLGEKWYLYYFYQFLSGIPEPLEDVMENTWNRFCRKRLRFVSV